jgi:hypothetical protein
MAAGRPRLQKGVGASGCGGAAELRHLVAAAPGRQRHSTWQLLGAAAVGAGVRWAARRLRGAVRLGVEALRWRLLGPEGPDLGFAGCELGSGCSSSSCVLGGARRSSDHCGSRAPERRLRSVVRSIAMDREDNGSDWPVARVPRARLQRKPMRISEVVLGYRLKTYNQIPTKIKIIKIQKIFKF